MVLGCSLWRRMRGRCLAWSGVLILTLGVLGLDNAVKNGFYDFNDFWSISCSLKCSGIPISQTCGHSWSDLHWIIGKIVFSTLSSCQPRSTCAYASMYPWLLYLSSDPSVPSPLQVGGVSMYMVQLPDDSASPVVWVKCFWGCSSYAFLMSLLPHMNILRG